MCYCTTHCVCPSAWLVNKHWKQHSLSSQQWRPFGGLQKAAQDLHISLFLLVFIPFWVMVWGFFGLYESCFSILHSRSWSSYSRISQQFPWEGGAPLSGWFQDEVCPLEHILGPWWKQRSFPCQAWVTLPVSVQTHCVVLAGFAESGFFPKMNARHCVCCCLLFACLNDLSLSHCCLGIKLNKPPQKWVFPGSDYTLSQN